MEQPLAYLNRLTSHDWLIGYDSREFHQKATELYLQLSQLSTPETSPKIILAEREPVNFLASFIAACAANCQVFLCNPDWGEQEWHQVFNLVQPDIILGLETKDKSTQTSTTTTHYPIPNSHSPLIMIPTGGSSGQIKFAIHTWETLTASVQGFREYFHIKQVNSYCILPLYHVSGLMQFMRSFTTDGKLVIQPFKSLESSQISPIKPTEFFISLVPTQLQRLLQNLELTTWLSQFNTVLLGGAPAWDELLEKAKFHNIRLAPTYGMTETASQIATLKPDDFLNGKINSGQILPHAQVTICNQQGEVLPANHIGNITIQAQSLSLGYYPQLVENQNYFQVDDLGFLDGQGYLNIVGRNSDKIITGGENIYPIEIESAIRATQMVADVCVIGIPDQQWGQALTAIYIPKDTNTSVSEIKTAISHQLSRFKIPKHWISLDTLPRNPQGKISRQQLQQIALLKTETK
ncbi:AMP-dependent synthetase and ligase [Trichormus variabilis ATCC 29413]|uniref:AMP-dependent synthetase and ligase n=2 Tax=Anabaena variabilis TaxID=264691 RepID=Q3M9T6_TRIV2|nr:MULTISPECIES: 2-succinylbenzoate--CoA ligase [Nostocaceae]ABA22250.1 AMP-dependent synthetase and ligase [Trichormus variabilis ATCC 29413]MBC1217232.1 2-succinylbenzoate--CoA ligase [Trichormus variabilis ARAD]MBC1257588.1 2-succinylbenzoate--CoA ligase [Trichormus variabilis V5]MBC1270243.1 2-succinylbenzoate--CoA ligase [Trichormus variabilis FSR]MBC1305212.1 2-succinylbenzoate--CoA ligase [Trichormus variabilis N2B]